VHGNQFRRIKKRKQKEQKKKETKNKKNILPCARSRDTAKHYLPCAPDLAHGKMNFKFRNRPRMEKLPKRKL